jgi:hypothetical protein
VTLLGDADADVEAEFAAAEAALRGFGAVYYLGRSLLDHAQWLDRRHRPAEALPLLDEAKAIFAGLGADAWLARAGGAAQPVTQGVPAGT